MSEEQTITLEVALETLRSTELPAGMQWYARSMDGAMFTVERKYYRSAAGVIRWLHQKAKAERAPLEFDFIMYHPEPAFRFAAGRLMFRIIQVAAD